MIALQATKHHPKSVDLELVKQLIQKTKYSKLQQFLCKEFDAINAEHAGEHWGACSMAGNTGIEQCLLPF